LRVDDCENQNGIERCAVKKQRKRYTPEEKVAILRRHLVEGVLISDLCDEETELQCECDK
jgi:hypothetical protein